MCAWLRGMQPALFHRPWVTPELNGQHCVLTEPSQRQSGEPFHKYTIQYPVPRPGLDPHPPPPPHTHTHTHNDEHCTVTPTVRAGCLEDSKCSDNSFRQLRPASPQHMKVGETFKKATVAVVVVVVGTGTASNLPAENLLLRKNVPHIHMVHISFISRF